MFERANKKQYFFAFVFVFALAFVPIHFSFFSDTVDVSGQTLPVEEITGSVTWSENRIVERIVIVASGATLTISKGVTIEFDGKSRISVEGKLKIEGTLDQPVILKKKDSDAGDSYAISAVSSGSIVARNADISGGGTADEAFLIGEIPGWRPSMNRARADWFYSGALASIDAGQLDVEGVNFHDNKVAVFATNDYNRKVKVWRSKFTNNERDFINGNTFVKSDLRYNWWGNENGPEICTVDCDYPRRTLEKIIGAADTSFFARTQYLRNPVVIIPGILGSWKMTDSSDFVLDPILGLYTPLTQTLDDNGYEKDVNLFVFPYEWRKSNTVTAALLRTRIEAIKIQTKWPRVDIVAHSMGGLVAREYIEMLGGGDSVDQLITIGTPQAGSPESYLAWEGGDFGLKLKDFLLEKIFQQEAEENGYATIFDYLTKAPISSVRELLPVYSYLRDQSTYDLRGYPTDYPKNVFLEKLNNANNISKLNPVWFTNIVGKLNQDRTITGFRVSNPTTVSVGGVELDLLWGHGKPDGYDDLLGNHGIESGVGDGTVPLSSASGITSDETIELVSAHNDLPTDAAKIVFNRLTGMDAMVYSSPSLIPKSMMIIQVYSPIDIQVISPSDKRMGKNFETGGTYAEIPGAFYAGYDVQSEFITIPNPEDGEYKILTKGTGAGEYRIEGTLIHENPDTSEAVESTAIIRGIAEMGKQEEKKVTIESNTVTGGGADTVAPTTEITLSGIQGLNDWYTSDVSVSLTAIDNDGGSGIKETKYSLDNGANWNVYIAPVIITGEGIATFQYFSTDQAGNEELFKTQVIKIDKTAPEAKIQFNAQTKQVEVIGMDNLLQNVSVVLADQPVVKKFNPRAKKIKDWFAHWSHDHGDKNMATTVATLTDEAGNIANLVFAKTKDRKGYVYLMLKSIAYNGTESVFAKNTIQYKWQLNKKGQYILFASHMKMGDADIESHYVSKRNETWIMERPRDLADDSDDDESDRRSLRKKLPGMVVPSMLTEQGNATINY